MFENKMLPNYQKLSRYLRASEGDYNATLEDLGIDPSKIKDSLRGGLADAKSYTDFPLDQLERGIKVEMEHTDDPYIAIEIVMDHLTEDRKYYTKLDKMEKSGTQDTYTGIPEEVDYDDLSQVEWDQFIQDHIDTYSSMYQEQAFGPNFHKLYKIYLRNAFQFVNDESGKRFKQDVQKALEEKFNDQN